jgi:hypothetical protein
MTPNLQLNISEPCQQSWDEMHPKDQGGYCGSCCKTVVDFTAMSDREIIAYLARTGQGICGRFAPDQLQRDISQSLAPRKRSWKGWNMLFAGLLLAIRLPAQTRPVRAATQRQGELLQRALPGLSLSPIKEKIASILEQDSLQKKATDSFRLLPPVLVTGYTSKPLYGMLGAVSFVRVVTVNSWKDRVVDTLSVLNPFPKKKVTVYPNPVRRGAAVSLAWQVEPGTYQVGIFNTAGALCQQHVLHVGSTSQVDLIEIPGSLSAGVYFIRAARAGGGKAITSKLVVL